MPTPVSCPQCDARFNANEKFLNRKIACPSCKKTVVLQELAVVAAHVEDEPAVVVGDEHEEDDAFIFGEEKSRRGDDGEMDLTPMVDVTFLLLIFFMITASFDVQKSFEQPLPDDDQPSSAPVNIEDVEDDPDFVVVYVTAYNSYEIVTTDWELRGEDELASKHDLLLKMREARLGDSQGNEPNSLLVRASSEAFYDNVMAALDVGAAVGMQRIQLVTIEEDEE
ncbi:MAG: biopolymer transporter ExbD [bacterium]|nr:biopolymer transporter ExbD [bacterium]